MLILHDSKISRSKLLMPVPKKQWMPSSLAKPKDSVGNETIKHKFRARAISNDGIVIWIGWFEDREDFDAFLFAISKNTLITERSLWDLPTPNWQPYLGEILTYDFASFVFLTNTGSNQIFNIPIDFNPANNRIHCIGAGGYSSSPNTQMIWMDTGGAGGGAYSRKDNMILTPGGTCEYFVASSQWTTLEFYTVPNGFSRGTGSVSPNTWFNGVTGTNVCVAASGMPALNQFDRSGTKNSNVVHRNFGGNTSACIGDVKYQGGEGSKGNSYTPTTATSLSITYYSNANGGGGSAGPNGPGGAGMWTTGQGQQIDYTGLVGYQAYDYTGGGGGANGGQRGFGTFDRGSYYLAQGGNNRFNTAGTGGYFFGPDQGRGSNGGGGGGGGNTQVPGGDGSMETTVSIWGDSYGPGGGGGGGIASRGFVGPNPVANAAMRPGKGASYGGGAGGGGATMVPSPYSMSSSNGASGGQGLIVVEYAPSPSGGFNSPMLGM